jgi:hypothetical protein
MIAMPWRQLAILVVVLLIIVTASATWSARRRATAGRRPVLIPGAVIQPPTR